MNRNKVFLAGAALLLLGAVPARAQIPGTGSDAVPMANPATPTATPAGAPVQAAVSGGPSCPAGKPNPATELMAKPDLPSSLQKLYSLRLPTFEAADLNCDGFLDAGEIAAMIDRKFAAADTNHDGVLSPDEVKNILDDFVETAENTPGVIVAPRESALKHRLTIMDTNYDGVISKAEFVAYYQARYQKLDTNGDGRLDLTEYQTDDEENRRQNLTPVIVHH